MANSDGGAVHLLVDRPLIARVRHTSVNAGLVSRWSPSGTRIAYLVSADEGASLWTIGADGGDPKKLIEGVDWFDWYRDDRHAIYSRRHGTDRELIAVNLETREERSLFLGALMEIDVAPDGSAVAFCLGRGHLSMGLAVLRLEPPKDPDELPRALGESEYVVQTKGTWHVHNGGWSPDSRSIVYTRDQDYGDIYELVVRR